MVLPLILPFLGSALGLSPWLAGALGSGIGSLIMNPDDPEAALLSGAIGGLTGGLGGGMFGGAGEAAKGAGEAAVLGSAATGADQLAQAVAKENLASALGQGAASGTGGGLSGIMSWMKDNPMVTAMLVSGLGGLGDSSGLPGETYDPSKYPEQFDEAGPRSSYSALNMPTSNYQNYGVPGSEQEGEFSFFPTREEGLSTMPVVPSGTSDEMMGGTVYGPGRGYGDTVKAFSVNRKGEQVPFLLQPGEYVMPKKAVDAIGTEGMDRIREELIRRRK